MSCLPTGGAGSPQLLHSTALLAQSSRTCAPVDEAGSDVPSYSPRPFIGLLLPPVWGREVDQVLQVIPHDTRGISGI